MCEHTPYQYRRQFGSWSHYPGYPREKWKKQVERDLVVEGYWEWAEEEFAAAYPERWATLIQNDPAYEIPS